MYVFILQTSAQNTFVHYNREKETTNKFVNKSSQSIIFLFNVPYNIIFCLIICNMTLIYNNEDSQTQKIYKIIVF